MEQANSFQINAGIQLVPINTKEHPYEWVDRVIELIRTSGLSYEVGPFNTTIVGTYKEVRELLDKINAYLLEEKCPEWLLNVQYQFRSEGDISIEEKIAKFRKD